MSNDTVTPAPLAPALTVLSTLLRVFVRSQGIARHALIPGIGQIEVPVVQAANVAARHYLLADDRPGAVAAITGTLTPGWETFRNEEARYRAVRDAELYVAWLETIPAN